MGYRARRTSDTTVQVSMDIEATASVVEIQQLAHRYSLAVDSRDMDLLASLFVPHVKIGRVATGRDALKRWYGSALRTVGATIHMVGNHIVDLDVHDVDRATGVVYCREETQDLHTGAWRIGMIQYWDAYHRVDGRWLFDRRKVRRWYRTDAVGRVAHDDHAAHGPGAKELAIPEAFPTWAVFWAVTPEDTSTRSPEPGAGAGGR
jgi:hypothetical protein